MKKTYVKPAMAVEMFTLAQSVARNCGVDGGVSTHWNEDGCGFWFSGLLLWSTNACGFILNENDVVDVLCYNAPDGNTSAFSS